jgi:two-component system LytT family response regulator
LRKIRAVIVEDEPLARDVLCRLVAGEKDIVLVAECADGLAGAETVRAERPDLLFLDIRLPGLNGLELLQSLDGAAPPAVIFVTASDRHAVRAFSSHAVDYLLKPFTRERFREAVNRARLRLRGKLSPVKLGLASLVRQADAPSDSNSSLSLKVGRGFVILRVEEIESVAANRGGSVVSTISATYRTHQTLGVLQKKLPPEHFIRANRSTLVNPEQVVEIIRKSHGDGRVRLKSGREVSLARRWRSHWAALLTND